MNTDYRPRHARTYDPHVRAVLTAPRGHRFSRPPEPPPAVREVLTPPERPRFEPAREPVPESQRQPYQHFKRRTLAATAGMTWPYFAAYEALPYSAVVVGFMLLAHAFGIIA